MPASQPLRVTSISPDFPYFSPSADVPASDISTPSTQRLYRPSNRLYLDTNPSALTKMSLASDGPLQFQLALADFASRWFPTKNATASEWRHSRKDFPPSGSVPCPFSDEPDLTGAGPVPSPPASTDWDNLPRLERPQRDRPALPRRADSLSAGRPGVRRRSGRTYAVQSDMWRTLCIS